MGHIAGGVRGGMGVGIILFGVLMGATTGIVGATVITLGLLTLPTLIRRGYDKGIACGAICASGTLGQIIPPSLILILLSDIMQLSVGTLFAAAVMPGMLLAGGLHHLPAGAGHAASPSLMPPHAAGRARCWSAAASCGCGSGRWWCRRSCWWWRCWAPSWAALPRRPRPRRWGRWAPSSSPWSRAASSGPGAEGHVALETSKITAIMMFILMMAQVFALAFRGLHGEDLIVRHVRVAARRRQCRHLVHDGC
jgi:hypothetical protein